MYMYLVVCFYFLPLITFATDYSAMTNVFVLFLKMLGKATSVGIDFSTGGTGMFTTS